MSMFDVRSMWSMFKRKWMIAEAVPLLIPVVFAGSFGVYSVTKKIFVDPELRVWSREDRASGIEMQEGNEFDIVYDEDCKGRFNAKMAEVAE